MPEQWIKVMPALAEDGRVREMARAMETSRFTVVGLLVAFWGAADHHARVKGDDGYLDGWTPSDVDQRVGWPGFFEALPKCWGRLSPDGFCVLPNYVRHNGSTAKTRLQSAERSAKKRAKGKDTKPQAAKGYEAASRTDRDERHASTVTKSAPDEDEDEEKMKRDASASPPEGAREDPAGIWVEVGGGLYDVTPADWHGYREEIDRAWALVPGGRRSKRAEFARTWVVARRDLEVAESELGEALRAYYAAFEGREKYARLPCKFMADMGWADDPAAWSDADGNNGGGCSRERMREIAARQEREAAEAKAAALEALDHPNGKGT